MAITFEQDSTKYLVIRNEYSWFDWIASIGGLSSLFFSLAKIIGKTDDPNLFVSQQLMAKEEEDLERGKKLSPETVKLKNQSTF